MQFLPEVFFATEVFCSGHAETSSVEGSRAASTCSLQAPELPLGLTQVLPHSSLHSAPASLSQQACAAGFFLASSVQATLTHWSAVCAHRDRVPSPGGSCRARVTHFWHFQRGGVQVPSRTPATPTTSSATKDFTAAKVTHGQAPRSAHATAPPCYVLTSPIVASLHDVC